ncbi:MAG: hypothetical protein NZ602_14090 [Thermoguttaceae bacterium]|nr:hypothetical protein [Thermoguttaceae bacterium]MDW8037619.1 hypothetical protein [Thermoguttaceae bacterium]
MGTNHGQMQSDLSRQAPTWVMKPVRLGAGLVIGALTLATLAVALWVAWQERQKTNIPKPPADQHQPINPPGQAAKNIAIIDAKQKEQLLPRKDAPGQAAQNIGIIDADGYARYGFRIAEGRGLVDDQGRPTAFRGPTYPLVCAGLALVFGPRLEVVQTAQCVFYALANGLIGLLAYRYGAGLRVVVLTMLGVMFFWPAWPWFCHIFTEPLFTLLLALILWSWLEMVRQPRWWKHLLTGLWLAVGALCRPEVYVLVPIPLLDTLRQHGWKIWRAWGGVAWLLVGFALLEVPWVVRNWLSVGRAILTADAGMENFFLATWYQEANWQGNPLHDPKRFPPAGQGFWQLPLEERNRIFRELAWQNIREAPGQVLLCMPKRLLMFFFQYPPRGWLPTWKSLLLGVPLYGLAVVGYLVAPETLKILLRRALAILAVLALVHTLLVSEFRYSAPVQPYVLLMASTAFWRLVNLALGRQWAGDGIAGGTR